MKERQIFPDSAVCRPRHANTNYIAKPPRMTAKRLMSSGSCSSSPAVTSSTRTTSPTGSGEDSLPSLIQRNANRNAELLKGIAETDYAAPQLKEQRRFVEYLKVQVISSDKKLKCLDRKKEKEFAEHESWRDSYIRRFAYKATGQTEKFHQRAAKEERDYAEVVQQIHQEKKVNQNLKRQVRDAETQSQFLQQTIQRHFVLQDELDTMYSSLFSGVNPQFPDEDIKEEMSNQTLQDYFDTSEALQVETRVSSLLKEVTHNLKAALGLMSTMLNTSRSDIFSGGHFSGFFERDRLTQAEVHVHHARTGIQRAQQASSQIRDLPPISIDASRIINDVFFDNIYTDVAFHREVKRAFIEVERARRFAERQYRRAHAGSQRLQQLLVIRERSLEQARLALQKAREDAFQKVA